MLNKYKGCFLGLAVGDALGAAVEFMSWATIKNKYGNGGIQDIDAPINNSKGCGGVMRA